MKIKELEPVVLQALEENKRTRKDDFILYAYVLYLKGIPMQTSISDFLTHARENQMPAFESVTRCRRHIQELRPDLKDQQTAIKREEAQEEYKNYNLSEFCEN